MKVSKLGILLMVAAVVLVLGAFRPGIEPDRAEASLAGILAVPSIAPGQMPAIAAASAPGNVAVVNVTCLDPITGVCPISTDTLTTALTFTLTRAFPDGAPAATFAANGGATLVCDEGAPCDLEQTPLNGNVAVAVNGGGQNEVVDVTACDQTGDCRTTTIIFVETIFAVSPLHTAASFEPTVVSYACPVRATKIGGDLIAGLDNLVDMQDVFTPLVGVFVGLGLLHPNTLMVLPPDFGPAWGCGTGVPQNRVSFETDAGILSVQAAVPATALTCAQGDSVDVLDGGGGTFVGCDLDGWDAVVSYGLEGTGDVGVATVTAQQLGGAGPLRTINVTFAGAPALSLFLDAPSIIGATGGDFTVTVVDRNGVPVGNETVECTVEPTGGAIAVIPQTGTTGDIAGDEPGSVTMSLTPTGLAVMVGEELTLTCVLDRDRSVSASATISLSMEPDLEVVDLVAGCNPIAATWADGTAASAVAAAVAPEEALDAIWAFDTAAGTWQGYSPTAPAGVSDLDTVDRLDAIFICVDADATVSRPVI